MTAPVVTSDNRRMYFVLPDNIQTVSSAPVPTDSSVEIKAVPPRTVAVSTFSGWFTEALGEERYHELLVSLAADGLLPAPPVPSEGPAPAPAPAHWVAQYHPPFTLPWCRRNEVWVQLEHAPGAAAAGADETVSNLAIIGSA